MAEPQALAGCVAYVACNDANQRLALVSRLRGLGAQVAARLGREVSHCVFVRAAVPTAEQKTQEDAELRSLFDRARKVGAGAGAAGDGAQGAAHAHNARDALDAARATARAHRPTARRCS
jgi:hypothetical protein